MKYFDWEIYRQLQSKSIDILMDAEEKWDERNKLYKACLEEIKEQDKELYKLGVTSFHDLAVTEISYDNGEIKFVLLCKGNETEIICINNIIKFNILKHKSNLIENFIGNWLVHEIIYNNNNDIMINILLDNGIEINIQFKKL